MNINKSSSALARASLLALCGAAALPAAAQDMEAQATRPPNLIVIITDDQGYADVGFQGCTDIPTPNMDRIAAEGVRFTNGYASFAVCGPSRAGLITGRYQDRFGASRNPNESPFMPNNGVPTSEKNIAELLKPQGYSTMAIGKWHLGAYPDLRPEVRGFDEFYGFYSGGHHYFPEDVLYETLEDVDKEWGWYRTKLIHNGKPVEFTQYLTDELSDQAVGFIEREKDNPFFLYLAYNAPHAPMQASDKYLDRFTHIENPKRKTYAAMISAVDDGVGRVLDKLAEHDLDRDTIVVFLSDNGGEKKNTANNAPLRGSKSSPYEGGIRVPFAMRWTGTIPAGQDFDAPVIHLDIAGTIVAQSGAAVPADKPLDGVNLVPFLTGEKDGVPHEQLFWRWFDQDRLVIRQGDEKLIAKDGEYELYDLAKDISEKNNLSAKRPDRVAALLAEAQAWEKELVPPLIANRAGWKPQKN